MKSRPIKSAKIPRSYAEIEKICEIEVKKKKDEIAAYVSKETAIQVVAAVLWTLTIYDNYGWKKKRLQTFFDRLQMTFKDMEGVGFIKEYNAFDIAESIKERFEIDLEKEITIQVKKEQCTKNEKG